MSFPQIICHFMTTDMLQQCVELEINDTTCTGPLLIAIYYFVTDRTTSTKLYDKLSSTTKCAIKISTTYM